jgi:hypothetical protein
VRRARGGFTSSQRRTAGGAVESEQRTLTTVPVVHNSVEGAAALGRTYWREVERATRGLVRLRERDGRPELRLLRSGPRLLCFSRPELTAADGRVTYRVGICGGLLARRPAGSFELVQTDAGAVELRSTIRGFYPSLAARPGAPPFTGGLYRLLQARLHVRISRRYFASLIGGAAR